MGRGVGGLESRAGKSHAGEEIDNLLHPDPQVPLPRACWEPSFAPCSCEEGRVRYGVRKGLGGALRYQGLSECTRRSTDWTLVSGLRGGSLWLVNGGCAPGVVP